MRRRPSTSRPSAARAKRSARPSSTSLRASSARRKCAARMPGRAYAQTSNPTRPASFSSRARSRRSSKTLMRDTAVSAAGACLRYARETQRAAAAHVTDISFFETHDHLVLDALTCRNLELIESQGPGARGASLLAVLDATVTGMGARLLRSWLLRPSVRRGEIESRLASVEDLHRSQMRRDRVRASLKDVSDLERLTGRINMGTATP